MKIIQTRYKCILHVARFLSAITYCIGPQFLKEVLTLQKCFSQKKNKSCVYICLKKKQISSFYSMGLEVVVIISRVHEVNFKIRKHVNFSHVDDNQIIKKKTESLIFKNTLKHFTAAA